MLRQIKYILHLDNILDTAYVNTIYYAPQDRKDIKIENQEQTHFAVQFVYIEFIDSAGLNYIMFVHNSVILI